MPDWLIGAALSVVVIAAALWMPRRKTDAD